MTEYQTTPAKEPPSLSPLAFVGGLREASMMREEEEEAGIFIQEVLKAKA